MPEAPSPCDPDELGPGGRALWDSAIDTLPDLPEHQRAILLEAARTKDRLDAIENGLGGDRSYLEAIEMPDGTVEVVVDKALNMAKALGETMAKHLATLRIAVPDGTQRRAGSPGGTRGNQHQAARGTSGSVSNIRDRARRAR